MKKIIFATGNQNKMREIREIYEDLGYEILSMKEAGISVDIVEDGKTFEENALIKARAIADQVDAIVLADDSGLEIDYLNKEPGIYSARYMGEDTSYDIKNANLIERLDGVPKEKRTARFVCAVAAVFPDGSEKVVRGTIEGYISVGSRRGRMDLAMIRSFLCRCLWVQYGGYVPRKKRTRSPIVEMHCVR